MPPFGVRFKLEAVDKGNKPDEKSACRGHGEPRMQADFVLWGPGLGLRLLKNTILSTDPCCRKVLSFARKKRRECFYNIILPFCPITFLAQPSAPFSASWRLAHPPVVMACFAEAVSNWTVIQLSNKLTSRKTKEGLRCARAGAPIVILLNL